MNFLAHIYLSGEDDGIKTGNFIGDYVKGKAFLDYPQKISEGIILHRNIDTFTDQHVIVKTVNDFFRPEYRLYSGIITDMVFDHFLAKNWNYYSDYQLKYFTKSIHKTLLTNFRWLPGRVKQFLPFLIQSKRLESYSTLKGLQKALEIMSKYTSLPSHSKYVLDTLEKNYNTIGNYFKQFMEEVINTVENEFGIEIKKPAEICRPPVYVKV